MVLNAFLMLNPSVRAVRKNFSTDGKMDLKSASKYRNNFSTLGLYFYHGFEHILNEKSVRPPCPLKVFGGFKNELKKCLKV